MYVLILGPAGSGKTLLTGQFGAFLSTSYEVSYVNLDPGAEHTPYSPDFDVRDQFTLREVMEEEGLGPNGAMIAAIDRLAKLDVPALRSDFVLVDTPGQLEPYVFRDAGRQLTSRFPECIGVFILDATLPLQTIPSMMLYSLAAQFSLGVDAVNVVNKVDLLERDQLEQLESLLTCPAGLTDPASSGVRWEINLNVADLLGKFLPSQRPVLLSAKTGEGFSVLGDILMEAKCACGDLT